MAATFERTRIETSPDGPGFTRLDYRGSRPGKHLVVLGGVHGDEPQGPRAAAAVARRLDGLDIAGHVTVVPVSHEAAFAAATRTSPIDGGNLAREFPGNARGTATQRLAALFDESVLAEADILIDMHSAGIHYAMPTLVGFCDDGSAASVEAARLADAAGMPVVWRHPGPPAAGRTGTGPHLRGVPFLYFESTDDQDQADVYADAVLRVMAASGMVGEAPPAPADAPVRLFGPGDLDVGGVPAERTGLLDLDIEVLDQVTEGQTVAHITEPSTGERQPVSVERDGIVIMHRRTTWLAADSLVAFLASPDERRA